MKRTVFLSVCLVLAGCSHIATVKTVHPPVPSGPGQDSALVAVTKELQAANRQESTNPQAALGGYLNSARAALAQLDRRPGNDSARALYNYSVGRSVEVVESARLDPWTQPLRVSSDRGSYIFSGARRSDPDHDPSTYEIIPADRLVTGGTFVQKRVTVDGIGAPVVAIGRKRTDFRKTFAAARFYGSATAIVRFSERRAQLEFFEPFATTQVSLGKHTYPLAADFTAPAAVGLSREHVEKLGLTRMLHPEKYNETARLTRLQVYDPNRIPVIFVHGLQDTPVSWMPMINELRADPEIRRRYQFWVFSYPSGYPYPYSAALFRKELDGVNKAFPNHKPIVLIGHSMGGIISRLMITDVGDKLWRDYFGKSPAETNIPGPSRQLLEDSLIFNHRGDVSRVVFVCAPHRGAPMGANWIGRIGVKLIHMPLFVATIPLRAIQAATVPDSASARLNRLPTSIDTLSPNNRFVREINKFPVNPRIPFHTIEGDRGRGDAPESSDGVVPYWSSHIEGAHSELIVPSDHSAPRNPQAIAEVRRILKLHR